MQFHGSPNRCIKANFEENKAHLSMGIDVSTTCEKIFHNSVAVVLSSQVESCQTILKREGKRKGAHRELWDANVNPDGISDSPCRFMSDSEF